MTYQVLDDDGKSIDAHCDIGSGHLILHSRGGTLGTHGARNTQYAEGLRALLVKILTSNLPLERVYVDSSTVQSIPIEERTVFDRGDKQSSAEEIFDGITSKMKAVGRRPNAKGAGNATKRLRFDFKADTSKSTIFNVVNVRLVDRDFRGADRLPADYLNRVSSRHIVDAVNLIRGGMPPKGYGPSTDYDVVLDDGVTLPPKAVFGLAASEALGFSVLPRHFTGGEGTPCFDAINSAGYKISRKKEDVGSAPSPSRPKAAPKEKSISRIVKTVKDTVRVASGQSAIRSVKAKHLLLSDKDLAEHVSDLYDRQQGKCALTGLDMLMDGETDDNQLLWSLDRIDSNGDYELGNLQLVCRFANFWKSNQPNSEFLRLIELVKGET